MAQRPQNVGHPQKQPKGIMMDNRKKIQHHTLNYNTQSGMAGNEFAK